MTKFEQWIVLAIGVPMLVVAIYAHGYFVRYWLGNRHKKVAHLEERMFPDSAINPEK